MFKSNAGYSRLDSPVRRADYSQYSAESARDGAGQTFHFSSPADDGSDDEPPEQEFELRSRGGGSGAAPSVSAPGPPTERTEYITHDVESSDTLQSISLRYGVPVSELKRANNLFTEKELCARRFLRVPVRPNSFLTERGADPPTTELVSVAEEQPESPQSSGRLSPDSAASTEVRPFGDGLREGNKLLKNVDRELNAIRARAEELRTEHVLLSAPTGPLWPPPPARSGGVCSCSGADCGLQWLCLLAAALLLLVVAPIWYIVREYETDNLGNHHTHGGATTPGAASL